MRFAEPFAFLFMILVPVLILSQTLYERALRRKVKAAGDAELIASLTTLGQDQGGFRRWLSTTSICIAVALISIALARPQFGMHTELRKARGMDVVIALDLSRSMTARDVVPSRLARARVELGELIDQLPGDRIGLVGFTSVAIPLCPLTVDHTALKLQLKSASPTEMPRGGTSLGQAIIASERMLESAPKHGRSKSIVIITDGENHQDNAQSLAIEAQKKDIVIHVAGVGSRTGEPIPLVDESGNVAGYLKDRSGQTVITRLDDASLRQVAQAGGGLTALPGNSGGLNLAAIREHLRALKREDLEDRSVRIYEERYRWALAPAFFFLLLGTFLRPRRNKKRLHPVLNLCLVAFLLGNGPFERNDPNIAKGNQALVDGETDKALESYQKASETLGEDPRLVYNRGLAQLSAGEIDSAITDFQAAAANSKDRNTRSLANFALGNAFRQKQNFKDAVTAYRQSLLNNPANKAARRNLQLAQAMQRIKELQPKQKNEDGENSEGENKDQKDEEQSESKDGGTNSSDGSSNSESNQNPNNSDDQQDGGIGEAGTPPPSSGSDDGGSDNSKPDAGVSNTDASSGSSAEQNGDGGIQDAGNAGQSPMEPSESLSQQQIEELLNALQEREKVLKRKRLMQKYGNQPVDKDW